MLTIVADASVLVPALADHGPIGDQVRSELADLAVYDAAYVALAERLQAEQRADVRLATADLKLSATPGLSIEFEEFIFDS